MITIEDVRQKHQHYCFVCKTKVNKENRYDCYFISKIVGHWNQIDIFSYTPNEPTVHKYIFVCKECWEITAGEDWMFSE